MVRRPAASSRARARARGQRRPRAATLSCSRRAWPSATGTRCRAAGRSPCAQRPRSSRGSNPRPMAGSRSNPLRAERPRSASGQLHAMHDLTRALAVAHAGGDDARLEHVLPDRRARDRSSARASSFARSGQRDGAGVHERSRCSAYLQDDPAGRCGLRAPFHPSLGTRAAFAGEHATGQADLSRLLGSVRRSGRMGVLGRSIHAPPRSCRFTWWVEEDPGSHPLLSRRLEAAVRRRP